MKSPIHCPSCSNYREPEDRFCKRCGERLDGPARDQNDADRSTVPHLEKPELRLKTRACPGCGFKMPSDGLLCVNCGLDLRTGRRSVTVVRRKHPWLDVLGQVRGWIWTVLRFGIKVSVVGCAMAFLFYFAHRIAEDMAACVAKGARPDNSIFRCYGESTAENDKTRRECMAQFHLPPLNSLVKLGFTDGRDMQGFFVGVEGNSVLIENNGITVGCLRHALTAGTRGLFFAEDYAANRDPREAKGASGSEFRTNVFSLTADAPVEHPEAFVSIIRAMDSFWHTGVEWFR